MYCLGPGPQMGYETEALMASAGPVWQARQKWRLAGQHSRALIVAEG